MKRKRKVGKRSNVKKPKIVKENGVADDVDPEGNRVIDVSDNDEADSGEESDSPSPVAAELQESSPVAADVLGRSPVAADVPESSPVATNVPKSSPVAANVPESSSVTVDVPKSSPMATELPKSSPVTADVPETSPMAADLPKGPPVKADVPKSSPVAAGMSKTSSVLMEKGNSVSSKRPIDDRAGKAVYTRVKVKIKSSKASDTQRTSSDALTQSDTDKSCQQVELVNRGAASEKIEDSGNSVPKSNSGIPGTAAKNLGSLKIMSVGFGSIMSPCSNVKTMKVETKEREPELPVRKRQPDKQQLDASLEVIKKVMKMEAAAPFNIPVDPVALKIPDYLEVIKTPMDFGTICNNIESGRKYLNSEDVYKDVQYIWDNCATYNDKGSPIMELMKKVKRNFLKNWIAAGLYCESGNHSGETSQMRDVTPTSDGGISTKNGPPAPTPAPKKHHGQEREESARMLNPEYETGEDYMDEDGNNQGDSSMGSPAEYSSKNMENGVESRDESMDDGDKFSELGQLYKRSKNGNADVSEGTNEAGTQIKSKEASDREQKAAMYGRLRYMKNPKTFELCGVLFDDQKGSVWNGPHSLIKKEVSTRKSSLLSAVSSFMK